MERGFTHLHGLSLILEHSDFRYYLMAFVCCHNLMPTLDLSVL
jgi:hypothetical protein